MPTDGQVVRKAATVVVLVPGIAFGEATTPFKLCFLKRSSKMKFMPNHYVFPVSSSDTRRGYIPYWQKISVTKYWATKFSLTKIFGIKNFRSKIFGVKNFSESNIFWRLKFSGYRGCNTHNTRAIQHAQYRHNTVKIHILRLSNESFSKMSRSQILMLFIVYFNLFFERFWQFNFSNFLERLLSEFLLYTRLHMQHMQHIQYIQHIQHIQYNTYNIQQIQQHYNI